MVKRKQSDLKPKKAASRKLVDITVSDDGETFIRIYEVAPDQSLKQINDTIKL